MKETDMTSIRNLATAFLELPIEPNEKYPMLVSHPFTNSVYAAISVDGELKMVDLTVDENAKAWREFMKKNFESEPLKQILLMMNTPYVLTFLKHAKPYISKKDMGIMLKTFWQSIEAITSDVNCTSADILGLFQYADKNTLMTDEQRKFIEDLPEQIMVYRGVTGYNRKAKNAFSWTLERSIAECFANRFNTGTGEIWSVTVPKKNVLAYFDGREKEVITDMRGFTKQINIQEF